MRFLQSQPNKYEGVAVTGHSLGGGLAIITGAMAGVPAVALSGPNAILTRKALKPQISVEALDSFTFNIVPDRDWIPRVDDLAQNFQQIRCRDERVGAFDCHDKTRSLCELLYVCGSGSRPVLCECHTQYGYPKPQALGARVFEDVCGQKSE